MTEREFMEAVRHLARMTGWRCYHTHDSRRSEPGFPDLVLVRGGKALFVELKTAHGRLTCRPSRRMSPAPNARRRGSEVMRR